MVKVRFAATVIAVLSVFCGCEKKERELREETGSGQEPRSAKTIVNSLGMKLAYISPGQFTMGSPVSEKKHDSDEVAHQVKITRAFYLGTTEVTQAQWLAIMGENASPVTGDDLPVVKISWQDAVDFCKKLSKQDGRSYRLPTEAQWEYACRAGTKTPFAMGITMSAEQANYNADFVYGAGTKGANRKKALPVGSFAPNDWGLYDMHGNVGEWCEDWYGDYPQTSAADPIGPASGKLRVVRGGSWNEMPEWCRSAYRVKVPPGLATAYIGLRVALDSD